IAESLLGVGARRLVVERRAGGGRGAPPREKPQDQQQRQDRHGDDPSPPAWRRRRGARIRHLDGRGRGVWPRSLPPAERPPLGQREENRGPAEGETEVVGPIAGI